MDDVTEQDWREAEQHFYRILDAYYEAGKDRSADVLPALVLVFRPLERRYRGGERSRDLYEWMLSVE